MASETKVGYNVGRDFFFIYLFLLAANLRGMMKILISDRLVAAVK